MVSEPYSRNPTLFPLPVFDQVARLSQRRVKKKPYIHSKHRLLELLTSNLRLLIESLLCKQSHLKCATVWKQAYINPTDDLCYSQDINYHQFVKVAGHHHDDKTLSQLERHEATFCTFLFLQFLHFM